MEFSFRRWNLGGGILRGGIVPNTVSGLSDPVVLTKRPDWLSSDVPIWTNWPKCIDLLNSGNANLLTPVYYLETAPNSLIGSQALEPAGVSLGPVNYEAC